MIQDQLVEYISSQIKTGISRDTIKSTLITAGWQSADVEDTLQKMELAKTSQPITASPVSASPAAKSAVGPQTIKMSDLISTSEPAMISNTASSSPATKSSGSKSFTGAAPASVSTKSVASSFSADQFPPKSASPHGALITEIVLGLLIIAIGGLAGYLYFQNNNLNSNLATLKGESAGGASQIAALQKGFNASTTAFTAQIATLVGQNTELQTELSFYVAPVGATAGVTSTATLTGTLTGGGKTSYLITATYGAKVYISNSKNANVVTALGAVEASSTSAQFTGIYMPGADSMTLTAVNGHSL